MKKVYIIIPKNQYANAKGEMIKITVDGREIGIPCETDYTSTASYDTGFYADEFIPGYHGFVGINTTLTVLCNLWGREEEK